MDIDLGVKPDPQPRKVALFMESGYGYSTRLEVHFSREHPYQLVDIEEVMELLSVGRFRIATPEEIKEYYNLED